MSEQPLALSVAESLRGMLLSGEDLEPWGEMGRRFRVALILGTRSDLLIRVARDAQNIPVVNEGTFLWYNAEAFRRHLPL